MTADIRTRLRIADKEAISAAAKILRRGGLVALPTETVYGLGANAADDAAVAGIFAAKGRPKFNPLIVHVRDYEHAAEHGVFPALARDLAAAFWPGPLTLVVPRKENCELSLLVSAGLDTVAMRAPSHPIAQKLLLESKLAIAAPSANPSGRLSATSAADVAEALDGEVDLILDGGPCPVGIESTVIGFDGETAILLRPGAIARSELEPITGALKSPKQGRVSSPGMLESHYAPNAKLRLDAKHPKKNEAFLAFGPITTDAETTLNLSPRGDTREAAANLFAMLRKLDASGATTIAVMPIPDEGLGEAINDRLRRAAAPRS
ncbi:MAG TPA: L-threonylcarbamoyladenylate synthase [Rhizomicrobium sp.]|jgi:L-threonylcarbamoyladenylate synthase